MEYEFFDHTADMMFRAYGKSIEERFVNAAYAMFSIIADRNKIERKLRMKIELESNDVKGLLYEFLEFFLIRLDSESFLLSWIEELKISEKDGKWHLFMRLWGDKADGYETMEHVKAVTYNSMEIDDRYVQVVLDM